MILPYTVYILKCSDNTFYTGFSANINNRLKAHQSGEVKYTKTRLPVRLIHMSSFLNKKTAYDF